MKFTNGNWLIKDGYSIYNPIEVSDTKINQNGFTLYAPCGRIYNRGNTLGGPLLTIEVTSPLKDIICVKIYHFKGHFDKGPNFELNKEYTNVNIDNRDDCIKMTSNHTSIQINKKDFSIDYFYNDKRMTGSSFKSIGYIKTNDGKAYMREQLDLGVGECVYGLGERFTPFVKNGQAVDIWNQDGGTNSEQAYKNIPFYITNKGYGVFVNYTGCVSYEIASERVSKAQFSVPGESLEYYFIGGTSPKNVIENYTTLTGKPALPPAWSFGLWLTTSFLTDYDEKTVTSFIDGMAQRNLPLHVFHFDCFWMKEFEWCNFEWDLREFPDPVGMLQRLKAKGLKICVWINPYIAQKSSLFDEGMNNGYLLKKTDGSIWQWDLWQPGMGIVDFTNPDAYRWFQDKLKVLVDMGVDCFKTDFGERIPTDVVYYDGSDPERMHNYYTYLYNKAVYEVLKDKLGDGNVTLFARSATTGSQKFPVHWGGDCTANYDSMAETLRGGLSLCLSGFGFWSHDIGGFENTATADVYKRWIAFGLLSSHSRLHGSSSYRVPWLFDEEAVDVMRFFTNLKCSLMPYIFSKAVETSKKGIPLMRAMTLEFCDDPSCDYLDRQYMLGDKLLVAPIFNEFGTVKYYLPKGRWTNLITNETIDGGVWIEEKHGYMSLPLMVRPNSIIPIGNINTRPDYDYADNVVFYVYEIENGKSSNAIVYDTNANIQMELNISKNNDIICISYKGVKKPWSIILVNIKSISEIKNGTYKSVKQGLKIIPDLFLTDDIYIKL